MPMGGAGCGLAQSITGLLEQRQVNIELSSFDLIEPSRDPAFPRTISVSFAVGLPSVQRTQEQQQAESLHEVSEAWGRWSPQAPERHTAVNTCPWMCSPRFSQPEECSKPCSMDTSRLSLDGLHWEARPQFRDVCFGALSLPPSLSFL